MTTQGVRRGEGAASARMPASSVPQARPPMLANSATVAGFTRASGPSRSAREAVAAPVTRAAEKPEITRATSMAPRFSAIRKTAAAHTDRKVAAISTGRRPTWSESRPKTSSPRTTPSA